MPPPLSPGDIAGDAALAPAGATLAVGAAIGFAAAGFFVANSVTAIFIASEIGIRATPLFLSTQAYVVRDFVVSVWTVFSFSIRA